MSPAVAADGIVGRRRELETLRSWLDAARGGSGRLVLCGGEPGIGKTRLARELAGAALARGTAVAWGRCVEAEGAPPFWPWRQVLRSVGADPQAVLAGAAESPEDRFRVFDAVAEALETSAPGSGLVVVVDDIHWADEPSLLVLRHLADHVVAAPVLVFATFRHVAPSAALRHALGELPRCPGVERLELRGFTVGEVGEQLAMLGAGSADAAAVLDVTGGNPLFVREVARAMAEGQWHPDRPPRTVLDVVSGRLDRVSPPCRLFLQAAAVVGRDFSVPLVADAIGEPVADCLPLIDEAVIHGLLERVGDVGEYRFVHALTRDAVTASLSTAARLQLHRAVAEAMEGRFAADLSEHVADIARHWAQLAPYGEGARARAWAIRAADDAVRRLAYEEGARLYRAALAFDAPAMPAGGDFGVLIALGRAAYLAGDLRGCVDASVAAADAARAEGAPHRVGEAALVLEAAPDPEVNAVAKQLCDEALDALDHRGHEALRARLLAQRSHLAFYDGQQHHVQALSAAALDLARASGDPRALVAALHARKEACPGPAGREERTRLASEMLALAPRIDSPRAAMWGELWRIDTLLETGQLAAAAEEVAPLQVAVARIGGPVSAWHLDRVTACVAQAQGRYAEATAAGRRAFDRMRPLEPAPATGAYLALQCALSAHVRPGPEAVAFAQDRFESPPRFRTMGRISRALLLLGAGLADAAAAWYEQAGPPESWSLPAFFVLPGRVLAALVTIALGRHEELTAHLAGLEAFRGEHVAGEGVSYLGPVELALGRGAAALGELDAAVDDLTLAAERAARAGAPGFLAEARYHLASALLARDGRGDRTDAGTAARDAERLVRALGMTAYVDRSAALLRRVGDQHEHTALSPREAEVAGLVAEGLTNRQIAERLVISERTAENHVQHILTKLGFTARSQIAAWATRRAR